MKWFARKVDHDPRLEAADATVAQAEREQVEVRSRWPMIRALADDLAAMSLQNNFGAKVRASFGEGR